MKKKIALLLMAVFVVAAVITIVRVSLKPEITALSGLDKAAKDLGYDLSCKQELAEPMVYKDKAGNEIIFNQFFCTDPERIKNGEVFFYTDVFNPKTAESVQDTLVKGEKALLYQKEGRSYLLWNPNENAIFMLDYNPDSVTDADIIKTAESCKPVK